MPKFRYLLALLLLPGVSQAQSTYLDTLPTFWRSLYPQGGSTLYCEYAFKPFDRNVNVEHVFPMSWVTRELRCGNREQCRRSSDRFNQIESDMHNMYPSLKQVNRQRGAYAYDNIKGEQWSFKGCDIEISQRRVEPAPSARGEIARAMLYMSKQYDLRLHDRQKDLMHRWHKAYPPGKAEISRNRKIEKIQGNANPFID